MPSMTLSQMRRLLRRGLGNLSETDLTDVDADEMLNISLWKIWQKFKFKERECRIYTETTDGVSDYGLDEDAVLDSIITVGIKNGAQADEGQYSKLALIDHEEYDVLHNTREDNRGKPTRYYRLQHTLILWPTPDAGPDGAGYTIRVVFYRTAATLLEGTLETTALPTDWDRVVLKDAIAFGHFLNEDYNLEALAQNSFQEDMRDAKLIRDTEIQDGRYSGLKVITDFPETP